MRSEGSTEQTDAWSKRLMDGWMYGWRAEGGTPLGLEITVRQAGRLMSCEGGADESGDEEIDPRSVKGEEGA